MRGVRRQWSPSWSPDGSRIAFVGGRGADPRGIYTVSSSGGVAKTVLTRPYVYAPRWSPDGTLIAFGMAGELHVIRPDGRGLRKVAEPNVEFEECVYSLDAPAWVPANRLAFVQWYDCRGEPFPHEPTIRIVRLDGTDERAFSAESTGRLVWSADGTWLVQSGEYVENNLGQDLDGDIVRMRTDGSGRLSLTRGRTGIDPDWQPVCTRLGTRRADRLEGSSGAELLCGLAGNDTISGGTGRDRLFGEDGNDRFLSRDGEFDVVGCGAGRDSVVADRGDLVGLDCERIDRTET